MGTVPHFRGKTFGAVHKLGKMDLRASGSERARNSDENTLLIAENILHGHLVYLAVVVETPESRKTKEEREHDWPKVSGRTREERVLPDSREVLT